MGCSPACSGWRFSPSLLRASSARSKSGSSSGDLIASAAKYQFREEKRSMHGSRRRAFVAVGGAVAVAIALAACGGTSNSAGGGAAAVQSVDLKLMVVELNATWKKIETICQFGIAPGEAEMVASKKADSIKTAADLRGKNLGVTDIGSGTHTITLALLGKAGFKGSDAHFVAVGAGNTFIAAIKNGTIDAGMTTEPTITRLLQSGDAKVLVDLRTPQSTRAALGGDYPFIGIFAKNDWVNSHKDVAQRLVNVYVKTLKWMKAHTAAEIADKMPADYLVPSKDLYVAALQNQLSIFGTDCKMPAAGPQTILSIEQNFVSSFKGKSANLSETYTNEFANKAS